MKGKSQSKLYHRQPTWHLSCQYWHSTSQQSVSSPPSLQLDNIVHTYFVHDPSLQFNDIFHTYFVHDPSLPAVLVTIASSTGVQALAVGTSVFHYSYRAETFLTRTVFLKPHLNRYSPEHLFSSGQSFSSETSVQSGKPSQSRSLEQVIFDNG